MPRSSESVPQRARPPFARRLRARASDGAIASALVFVVCLLALRFAPPLHEAQAVLGVPAHLAGEEHAWDSGRVLFGAVRLATADDFSLGYPEFSDRNYAQVIAEGQKLRVRCRDGVETEAVAHCAEIVALALLEQPPYTLISAAAVLPRTVSPLHWPGVWLAVVVGVVGGFAFAAYSAAFRKSKRPILPPRKSTPSKAPVQAATSNPEQARPSNAQDAAFADGRPSSTPAPVHIFTLPPTRASGRPSARAPNSEPKPSYRPAPVDTSPPVEIVAPAVIEVESSTAPRRTAMSDGPAPIQGHVAGNGAASGSGVSRTLVGWTTHRAPSAPNDSLPAPPMPEGPLVHAVPIAGGYKPHPRLIQRAKDPTFEALCTRITWNAEGEASVVGVIGSPEVGPRAAVFAARLAWFLAAPGKLRVLLLEADLEEPTLHRVMGVEAAPQGGFSQQLQARLGPARREPWRVQRCAPTLDVLVESRFRTHRAAHAPQFEHAVEVFRLHYDVVIAALPPLGVATGGAGFAYLTDGIVVVVPEGQATREPRAAAAQTFGEERLLAVVEGPESGERVTIAPIA